MLINKNKYIIMIYRNCSGSFCRNSSSTSYRNHSELNCGFSDFRTTSVLNTVAPNFTYK